MASEDPSISCSTRPTLHWPSLALRIIASQHIERCYSDSMLRCKQEAISTGAQCEVLHRLEVTCRGGRHNHSFLAVG